MRGVWEVRFGAAFVLLFVLAACDLNYQRCSEGAVCEASNSGPSTVPSVTPTPTPSPSPTGTPVLPDPCDPDGAVLKFHSSPDTDRFIGPSLERQVDFTPEKDGVAIPDSCNTKRWPVWSVETIKVVPTATSVCTLIGTFNSYIPVLKASNRTGDRCVVRASLSVSSGDKVVKHEAQFEAEVR